MNPSLGTVLGGKYRLERPLAEGGMGSIWVARHLELDTPVAVKLIGWLQALKGPAVERFRREARLAAQIKSMHIVQVLDYGVESGVPFMVMELLDGEDLEKLIERDGPLAPSRVVEIIRAVGKALGAVHDAGLVHRDIKPANVYLAKMGSDEVVKIVDFGIAREESPTQVRLTKTSQFLGSPLYMSPEQFLGDPVTRRTDLWSLAMVAFEALTGVSAVDATTLAGLHVAIVQNPIEKISKLHPAFAPLDGFFEKAFEKDPTRRFADAAAFLAGFNLAVSLLADRDRPILSGAYTKARAARQTGDGASHEATRLMEAGAPSSTVVAEETPKIGKDTGTLDPSTTGRRRLATTSKSRSPMVYAAGGFLVVTVLGTLGWLAAVRRAESEGSGVVAAGEVAPSRTSGGVAIVPGSAAPSVSPLPGSSTSSTVPEITPSASAAAAPTTAKPLAGGTKPPSGTGVKTGAPPVKTAAPATNDKWGVPVSR